MDNYFEILKSTSIFADFKQSEIKKILEIAGAWTAVYEKGETAIWEGTVVNEIGIILSGRGRSIKTDDSGKTFIISLLEEGSFIGVLLAASRGRKSPVSVKAVERMTALFIPFDRLLSARSLPRHDVLLGNVFNCVSEKSMELYDRIDCIIRPTVRDKISTYLLKLSNEAEASSFMSPLDRNAMAEYLNVDRSALSRELSRMKQDGMIDYYKNSFKVFYL